MYTCVVDNLQQISRQVCHCVRQVTLAALTDTEVNEFRKEVARRMLRPPWDAFVKSNINVSSASDF